MLRLILNLFVITALVAFMLITTLGRTVVIVSVCVALVLRDRYLGFIDAWSQRSGGRAARAEHIENATVSA